MIGGVPEISASPRVTDSPSSSSRRTSTTQHSSTSARNHYHPRTAALSNLNTTTQISFRSAAIETQFHHLVAPFPRNGLILANGREDGLKRVLDRGCWTPVELLGVDAGWSASAPASDGA
jgi:UDP-N-acetylmuramate: L-alanyl-gamma-D-glutamyl-meso-diaminopimelate ligase